MNSYTVGFLVWYVKDPGTAIMYELKYVVAKVMIYLPDEEASGNFALR